MFLYLFLTKVKLQIFRNSSNKVFRKLILYFNTLYFENESKSH